MRRGLVLPAVFTLVGVVILAGMGGWQWQRMGQKEALIATIADRTTRAPRPFPAEAEWPRLDAAALAYQPVELTGSFDHGQEIHVFFSIAKPVNGVGGPGYLVLTPFHLVSGGVVLVNRGFVPTDRKDSKTRAGGQVSGPLTLTGLVRLPEQRNAFSAADDAAKNVYFVRDPATLARSKGLGTVAPVTVDLKTPVPPGGLPVPAQTQVDIPNHHLQYAMTWWSLGLALAMIFLMFARERRP